MADATIWAVAISNVRVQRGLGIPFFKKLVVVNLETRPFLATLSSEPLGRGEKIKNLCRATAPNGKKSIFGADTARESAKDSAGEKHRYC